jgi:hypothetical protein
MSGLACWGYEWHTKESHVSSAEITLSHLCFLTHMYPQLHESGLLTTWPTDQPCEIMSGIILNHWILQGMFLDTKILEYYVT